MDFTTEEYVRIITAASRRYQFLKFGDEPGAGDVAIWRHDIDFSPQRALAVARMEADHGVSATYFVQISSRFYNVFEPEIAAILRQISDLGHDIGVHFDADVCAHQASPDYLSRLAFERRTLEEVCEHAIASFSLHNPTTMASNPFNAVEQEGMINASHPGLRGVYQYCSDSNGVWRFQKLADVIADPAATRLYALTHPEWWQDMWMSPRERMQRCIDGRAAFCGVYYDDLLKANNRPNIAAEK